MLVINVAGHNKNVKKHLYLYWLRRIDFYWYLRDAYQWLETEFCYMILNV